MYCSLLVDIVSYADEVRTTNDMEGMAVARKV